MWAVHHMETGFWMSYREVTNWPSQGHSYLAFSGPVREAWQVEACIHHHNQDRTFPPPPESPSCYLLLSDLQPLATMICFPYLIVLPFPERHMMCVFHMLICHLYAFFGNFYFNTIWLSCQYLNIRRVQIKVWLSLAIWKIRRHWIHSPTWRRWLQLCVWFNYVWAFDSAFLFAPHVNST